MIKMITVFTFLFFTSSIPEETKSSFLQFLSDYDAFLVAGGWVVGKWVDHRFIKNKSRTENRDKIIAPKIQETEEELYKLMVDLLKTQRFYNNLSSVEKSKQITDFIEKNNLHIRSSAIKIVNQINDYLLNSEVTGKVNLATQDQLLESYKKFYQSS